MPVSTKLIQSRISSVKNTRKITKAMELVAASKMRKATARVIASRPYSKMAWEIISELSRTGKADHPLLVKRELINKILVVLITSDRGLCGGFNAQIIKRTVEFFKSSEGKDIDIIACGKYAERAARKNKKKAIAFFNDLANNPAYRDVAPVGKLVIDEYSKGSYEKVMLAFTDFKSAISQIPRIMPLLPLEPITGLGEVGEEEKSDEAKLPVNYEYKFEPNIREVLDKMLPRLVETQIYQAILESAASEHSARMVAMKNASDSATEMIDDLTFTFNQARQAGITKEILEISSGKIALENN